MAEDSHVGNNGIGGGIAEGIKLITRVSESTVSQHGV